jgi:methionyl-tRNA synthetase
MADHILICVAWPYANGPLHLGHVAGCYLPADIFARYHRLKGREVLMVSGSDSHGTPVTLRAESEKVSPKSLVDKYHASFLDSWARLGVSFDLFTTTMTDMHRETAHDLIRQLDQKGYIYSAFMKVAYSPTFQRYLPDRYVEGTCPYCSHVDARGDQCDQCGRTLDPIDLINPTYRTDGEFYPVEIHDAKHLFLKLSAFQQPLSDWVGAQKHWRLNVRNFTQAYLREGLHDRAISRDLEWGIPLPIQGFEDKRIYVWFEAVMGYLSASKEWAANRGAPESWRSFWQNPDTRAYYFMGKDNIVFHSIIWPAMILGYGGLNLPYDIPANGWLTLEGQKLSTSRNWAVWLNDYLDQFEPDPLRYALAANMAENSDADFSWAEYVRRNNDELVATFGNLVHRVLTIIQRNFDGRVPFPAGQIKQDIEMVTKTETALAKAGEYLEICKFREALQLFMGLARDANRYLDATAPWRLVKEDQERAASVLYTALHTLAGLKVIGSPFLPFSAQRLHQLLGFKGGFEDHGWTITTPESGTVLPAPIPLFSKLDDSVIAEQSEKLAMQIDQSNRETS